MQLRIFPLTVAAFLLSVLPAAADPAEYAVKEAETPPPKVLDKSIGDLLGKKSIQFLDAKGELVCELWFCKEVAANATSQQLKNGITFQEVPETTLLGVVQFARQVTDFRKQKIKPGVYTLRLGFQPSDGDHMGTAPYKEFCLLIPAEDDRKPGPLESAKDLQERSTKATGGSHPGVLLLWPEKDPGEAPKLFSREGGCWVVALRLAASAKNEKGLLILGLTLVGTSPAA
jgi:hypothetical protein